MKDLNESQRARLEAAVDEVDRLMEKRQPSIPDELALTAVIDTFGIIVRLLEAGEMIRIEVVAENGRVVASAPLALEPDA